MYSISNRQRDEIMSLLTASAEDTADRSTTAINRRRRAMLIVRKLEKRKPYAKTPSYNRKG